MGGDQGSDRENTKKTRATQDTGYRSGKTLGVSEFDIMVVAMIAIGAVAATTLLTTFFLGKSSGGTDFGQEVLTNSTIGHEDKKSIAPSFFFDFENGDSALLIILTCGILLFLLSLGCCLFFCGSSCFGCRRCKRTREDFYREQYYANRREVNNGNGNNRTEVIEMT